MRRWLIPPTHNAAFVAAMEDVLAVYARPADPLRPLVCFDEAGKDLKAHTRPSQPAAPGRLAREDSEYARARQPQSVSALCPLSRLARYRRHRAAHRHRLRPCHPRPGRRRLPRRRAASCWCWTISTPIARPSLYQAFPPAEAWRLLEKLEWHYTPTHGSWLNMAELEWSVLARQCLARRIPDAATLEAEVAAWVAPRNAEAVTASWHFTKEAARQRLHWLYPCHD